MAVPFIETSAEDGLCGLREAPAALPILQEADWGYRVGVDGCGKSCTPVGFELRPSGQ